MPQRNQIQETTLSLAAVNPVGQAAGSPTGIAIDKLAYDEFREVLTVVQTGAATGTPTSYTVDAKIQESATSGGTYTDVVGATITQITADSQKAEIYWNPKKLTKRFFRLLVTTAFTGGTSPTVPVAGVHLLHNFAILAQA